MLVPFLGDRPPLFLAGRFPLGAAQAAVTDRLANGGKSSGIADLQYPGQGRQLSYAGNGHETFHSIAYQVVSAKFYSAILY